MPIITARFVPTLLLCLASVALIVQLCWLGGACYETAAASNGTQSVVHVLQVALTTRRFASSLTDVGIVAFCSFLLACVTACRGTHAVFGGTFSLARGFAWLQVAFALVKLVFVFDHGSTPGEAGVGVRTVHGLVICFAAFACASLALIEGVVHDSGLVAQAQAERLTPHGKYSALINNSHDDLEAVAGMLGPEAGTAEFKHASTWRVIGLAGAEKWLIILATVFLVLTALANLAIPALFGQIIESVEASSRQRGHQLLRRAVLEILIVFCLGSVLGGIRGYLFELAGQRLVARLRCRLFDATISQETGFFDVTRTGELMNRLSSDAEAIQDAATVNLSMLLRSLCAVLGGIIILFVLSWKLTLLSMSLVPVISIAAVLYGRQLKQYRKVFQDELASSATTAEETISQIRTVRSFSRETLEMQRYALNIAATFRMGKKTAVAYGLFTFGVTLAASLGILAVLYVGGLEVIDGTMSAGSLTAFLLYTLTIGINLATVTSLFGEMQQAIGASERIFQLLDRQPLIPIAGGRTSVSSGPQITGAVELRDVVFAYPSRPDVRILDRFNLTLRTGEITALVGPSGGGKSTCIALIERFYDVLEGAVLFDGTDVRELDLRWLRRHIALVPQDSALFACSIRDNIAYGCDGASLEAVMQAAREANAHEFISNFPDGYNTQVGERGIRLSGGQRQRIAIARALLLNPRLLLLDEATSALDAESESLVQEAIDRLMVSRTTLIIAHRLSTVRNAHQVVVVDNGAVAEVGTHDSLIKAKGVYCRLVARQLQGAEKLKIDDDEPVGSGAAAAAAVAPDAVAAPAPAAVDAAAAFKPHDE